MATCGTITVAPSFSDAAVTIESCSLNRSSITPGESVSISVTVRNDNDVDAQVQLVITANGQALNIGTGGIVSANGSRDFDLSTTWDFGEGDFDIAVEIDSAFSAQAPARSPAERTAARGCGCGGSRRSLVPSMGLNRN